ncbi:MAG: ChbG/HpnK family deacetylase [Actinobacteria bacterium ATB1]|nr:ChbG/HpnK family deacetylase [Actinobacteria bacterium ATB1]
MNHASLAERLGYRPDDRLLIVNCDDLGSSHAANLGIFRALRGGLATTTTLMTPCPWVPEAVTMENGDDIGVHLTLNAEWDTCRWGPLTGAGSLRDAEGYLPRTVLETWEAADPADVHRECRAQIRHAIQLGIDVTHLDSHMGTLQLREDYFEIYLELAVEFDLPLRLSGAETEAMLGFEFRGPAADAGVLFPDHFVFAPTVGSRQPALAALASLPEGITEMYVHPAVDGPELRAFAPDWEGRTDDLLLVTESSDFREAVAACGAKLVGYREIRDLQRETRAAG